MKLLIVHRHFWPSDLPYAQMLGKFVLAACAAGHDLTVISPCQSADELTQRQRWAEAHNVRIVTTLMSGAQGKGLFFKAWLYFRYIAWLSRRLWFTSADVVWVATTPPVIAAALVRILCKWKNQKYIYHCQDIHPEASVALGFLTNRWLARILCSIDKKNVEKAARTIVLSSDMRQMLVRRGCNSQNVVVINNFVRKELFDVPRKTRNSIETHLPRKARSADSKRCPKWIFAGTIGHFQNLELLLDALLLVEPENRPDVTFVGDGALLCKLRKKAETLNESAITFLAATDSVTVQSMMQDYDVGIVSLAPGIIDCAYPSKVVSYLAAGLKIYALVEPLSDLGKLLAQNKLGLTTGATNASALASDISRAVCASELMHEPNNSIAMARLHFGSDRVLNMYLDTLDEALTA